MMVQISYAQVVGDQFGRVNLDQSNYKWFRYTSQHFSICYTKENKELAKQLMNMAELDYVDLSKVFEYRLRKKIELIIFPTFESFDQSNIQIREPGINEGGVTRIIKPMITVHVHNDINNIRGQIRSGIGKILLGKILAGTNLQELVQNSVLMNLPDWFLQGAVAFASDVWDSDYDNQMKDILYSGRYLNFIEFARDNPTLAGFSLFHFVHKKYNLKTISNLIYLTRINRSVESGFLYVFGKTFYQVIGTDWFNFYSKKYGTGNKRRYPTKGKLILDIPKKSKLHDISLSPNAKKVAFSYSFKGVCQLAIYDISTHQMTKLDKLGEPGPIPYDPSRRLLFNWISERKMAYCYFSGNTLKLISYDINTKKKTTQKIKGLNDVAYLKAISSSHFILAATKGGISNIYSYQRGRLRALTKDRNVQKEADYFTFQGKEGIIYAAIPFEKDDCPPFYDISSGLTADIFFTSFDGTISINLTKTPLTDERHLQVIDSSILFLSDQNGIFNRRIGQISEKTTDYSITFYEADTVKFTTLYQKDLPVFSYDSVSVDSIRSTHLMSHSNTDYSRNVLAFHAQADKIADLLFKNGRFELFVRNFDSSRNMGQLAPTRLRLENELQANFTNDTLPDIATVLDRLQLTQVDEMNVDSTTVDVDTGTIDLDNYEFQSDYTQLNEPTVPNNGNDIQPKVLIEESDGRIKVKTKRSKVKQIKPKKETKDYVEWDENFNRKYSGLFRMDELTIQFDNSILYNGYDMYLGGNYRFQPLSINAGLSFRDLLENFDINVGVRVPLSFNGMEYYVDVDNRRERIDQRYSFYRRSRLENYVVVDTLTNLSFEAEGRNIKHLVETQFSYPISKYQSARLLAGYQHDMVSIISNDIQSLQVPNYVENRVFLRGEYVFDNSLLVNINVRKGMRFKAYMEYYQAFTVETADQFKVDLSNGETFNLGFDGRFYHSFDNKTGFACRIAGASSFGSQRMLYTIGGVENAIFPSTSNNISLPDSDGFGLQSFAGNLRGFSNNIRNGSSYLVSNFEMRIPIIEYFSSTPPRNSMLRSLQLVFYFDAGTAWQGLTPFSADNPLFTSVIDNNGPNNVSPVRVTVNYFRRPFVYGFGFGMRTILFGHYLKIDYGWGVETGQIQAPMLHFSIGTDF